MLAFWPNLLSTLSHLMAPIAVGNKHMRIKDPADLLSTISAEISAETLVLATTPHTSTTFIQHGRPKSRPMLTFKLVNVLMLQTQAGIHARGQGTERPAGDEQATHLTLL